MATKIQLIAKVLKELRRAQHERWTPPPTGLVKKLSFPPSLPLGDGRQLHVTESLLAAISDYSEICLANDPSLRPRFKLDELYQLLRRAFGKALESVELDTCDEELCDVVKTSVEASLIDLTDDRRRAIELTLGCHLFVGDAAYPIRVGPVTFETRKQFQQRLSDHDRISKTTARRLVARWSGRRPRNRKPSNDQHSERAILDAVGNGPIACSVATEGLSSNFTQEKGLLSARLAMAAVSLMWAHPAQGLEWMNLEYDGESSHRYTAWFGATHSIGSSSSRSRPPIGRWTDAEFIADLKSYQWLFDQIGEALFNFVQPQRCASRPTVLNALFLSLWWFHDACREPLDQMATTKFAASMEALTGGNNAKGIIRFIGVRLGRQPNDALMKDGRTTKKVVDDFYHAGRSRLIHGSSQDFAHDWSQVRSTAEAVGRRCLIAACDWMTQNPNSDDLEAMSQP